MMFCDEKRGEKMMNKIREKTQKKKHKHLTCKFIHSLHLSKKFAGLFFKTMKSKNPSVCCLACVVNRKFINPDALNAYT